jgi:EXLDI family protein
VRKSGPPHEPGHAHSGGPSGSASGSASASGGARDSSTWTSDDERRLDVYDTVDELIAAIGPELAEAVTRALHGEEDEFLDI